MRARVRLRAWVDQLRGGGVPFEISGFTESPLRTVSGSDVWFGISAGPEFHPIPGEYEVSFWRPKDITDMALTIGGQAVALKLPTTQYDPPVTWAKLVSFQSNHFAHDSTQSIQLTVKATFEKVRISDGVILETTGEISGSVTASCKIRNDLLSWRTLMTWDGGTSTDPRDYPAVADNGLTAARPKFAAMKHDVPDSATLAKSAILTSPTARLLDATGVFAFTHGSAASVQDSNGLEINVGEFYNRINDRAAGMPGMNFGIFYACSTYSAASSWFNAHFGASNTTDHFFVGFPEVVVSILKAGDTTEAILVDPGKEQGTLTEDLSEHAVALVAGLQAGNTITKALLDANMTFTPREAPTYDEKSGKLSFARMFMKMSGDGAATVNKVYQHAEVAAMDEIGDPIAETYADWYITW